MAKVLSETELASIVDEFGYMYDEWSSAGSSKEMFCRSWPVVKKVLKFIGSSSNSWVKLAVQVVQMVGNALSRDFCS